MSGYTPISDIKVYPNIGVYLEIWVYPDIGVYTDISRAPDIGVYPDIWVYRYLGIP
jgi:hypothetical protein